MNIRHAVILTAVAAAPLMTGAASARTLVQLYKDLAATPREVNTTPERRAATLDALGVMPADVEACLVVTDASSLYKSLPMVHIGDGQGLDRPNIKDHIETFGVAVGKGNAEALTKFMPIYQYLAGRVDYPARAEAWTESARAEYSGIIGDQVDTDARKPALDSLRAIKSIKLHPVYFAVTVDVPAQRYLNDAADDYIKLYEGKGGTRVTEAGCKGVKIPFKAIFDMPQGDASIESTLRDEIAARSLYLLFKVQKGALVAIICEDPAEVQVADAPAKSVLSTDAMKFGDPYLLSGMSYAAYISPELINAANSYSQYDLKAVADFSENVFKAMGEEDNDNVAAYNAAARSVQPVLKFASSYVRTDNAKPFTFCSWQEEDGMHAKVSFDSYGSTFSAGHIRLARIGKSDKVLFYMESTPEVAKDATPMIDIVEPALNLAAGYATSLEPTSAEDFASLVKFMPRLKPVLKSLKGVCGVLGDAPAVVVMPNSEHLLVSYFNAVKDRKALGTSGDELVGAAGRMIGGKGDSLKKLIKSKKGKTVVSHTADMSSLRAGEFELNVTMTDTLFAFGNSAALNANMIKHGKGKINFSGAVYTLRPAALAIASQLAPEAGMLAPMVQGIGAVHVTNTINNGVRTLHVLLANPEAEESEDEEE